MASHDPAKRRRGRREGREQGCWVYIPAELLQQVERSGNGAAPFYRTWGVSRGTVIVKLYNES